MIGKNLNIVLMIVFINILGNSFFAQVNTFSKELIDSFKNVRTIFVEVNQEYEKADKVNLPVYSNVKDLFEYLGFKVTNDDTKTNDAMLTINLEGYPLSSDYLNVGRLYTGAKLISYITIKISNWSYSREFDYIVPTATMIFLEPNKKADPNAAPFTTALNEGLPCWIITLIADLRREELLVKLANHKSKRVKGCSIKKMGELKNDELYTHVVKALKDKEPSVRIAAIAAIDNYKRQDEFELLANLLKDKDEDVAGYALSILARTKDERVFDILMKSINDKRSSVATASIKALGYHNATTAIKPIIDILLKDKGTLYEIAVEEALKTMIDDSIVPLIIPGLKHKNAEVRETVGRILSTKKDIRAIEPLISALEKEELNSYTINVMFTALYNITGKYLKNDPQEWKLWWEQNKDSFKK
ncbi:MAG: HEAT repeat domain-containing protein [Bacteroidota bacterium]